MKLLLGPPSSGKSDIAKFLVEEFNMIHINLSKIYTERRLKDIQILSIMKSGDFMPPGVIELLLMDELSHKRSIGTDFSMILLEGYPTTIELIRSLNLYTIESVIWLECPENECITRMIETYADPDFDSYLFSHIRYSSWKQSNMPIYWYFRIRGNLSIFDTTKEKHTVREKIARQIFSKKNYKLEINSKGEPFYGQSIDWEYINNVDEEMTWKLLFKKVFYVFMSVFCRIVKLRIGHI